MTSADGPKLGRMHALASRLLEELHHGDLDTPSRQRLKQLSFALLVEVGSALDDRLLDELGRLAVLPPCDDPSDEELRVLDAQLVGWLNGLALGGPDGDGGTASPAPG